MITNKAVRAIHLKGLVPYEAGLKLQKRILRTHLEAFKGDGKSKAPNVVILLEHSPVYTIGIRSIDYSREDEARLRALGADFHQTNRGGLITFHGPGQLVAYPIFNMKDFNIGMREYICNLERSVISMCSRLNIKASTSPDTGVWVGNNKLTAIGVHGKRFVTSHGLGINCSTDLEWFSHIVPCGIVGKGVTSLSRELNQEFTVERTIPLLMDAFEEQFSCKIHVEKLNEQETDTLLTECNS